MTICNPGLAGLSDFQSCDVPFRLTKINQCFLTKAAASSRKMEIGKQSEDDSLWVLLVTFLFLPLILYVLQDAPD